MKIGIVTLFPKMFEALTSYGVTSRAFKQNIIELKFFNPRDYTDNKYNSVDDRPFGGGPGMIMSPQPLKNAISKARDWIDDSLKVVYLSPQGALVTQSKIKSMTDENNFIFIAGRYEGIDERIIQTQVDEELSIGDYIVSGGELPAMVILDALVRYKPGVLGNPMSKNQDSFSDDIFDFPNYTRPEIFDGIKVPEVLLSGHHSQIKAWRDQQAIKKTKEKRPDLLNNEGSKKKIKPGF